MPSDVDEDARSDQNRDPLECRFDEFYDFADGLVTLSEIPGYLTCEMLVIFPALSPGLHTSKPPDPGTEKRKGQ